MKKINSLLRLILGKAALCAVLTALCCAAAAPLFAQTAEVRYAGVFYKDAPANNQEMYCDYTQENVGSSGSTTNANFLTNSNLSPTTAAGTMVNDGELNLTFLGISTTKPSSGERTPNTNYNVGTSFYIPQTISTTTYYYPFVVNSYNVSEGLGIDVSASTAANANANNKSFVFDYNNDPWVGSALLEYDQPYPSTTPGENKYPNHCLALCMNVYCTNKPMSQSTYSIAFPLQQVKFDIVKYYNGKNVENPEETPAVRTIDLYPNLEQAKCGSYVCPGGPNGEYTCSAPKYELVGDTCYSLETGEAVSGQCQSSLSTSTGGNCENYNCNYIIFNNDGVRTNQPISFCAAWDGSYEIGGEFGKSNGDFAFRATVSTDAPGDNIITDKIEFTSTIAYPGMNQIPIQVDVSNVHTVRSTPTVVGNITAVSAQPYTLAYRLSKDSDVRVALYDASNGDNINYGENNTGNIAIPNALVRTLVDWQPRLGEGMKGTENDTQLTEFDSWDGRNDDGLLLPAGNYIASIQAKAQDEWPGVDFSRAVTRQISLDPLKLTDIVVTGLNKKSTAYASINYVPTEASKVYWEIYTPGTTFSGSEATNNLVTDSSTPTGTGPTPVGGTLVYRSEEDRTARMNFTSKWDGLCGIEEGCTRTYAYKETMSDGTTCTVAGGCQQTFAYGAPMPDGNYVYVLWAEIPYNGKYLNAVGGNGTPSFASNQTCSRTNLEINGQCFTGVKTQNYSIGQVSVERGLVDITIQPVSYSTVGSSPTAYGLDPFIFKYSIVRDATVMARVENSAGVPVKHLTPEEGVTQVAQQLNTLSWDGRDDQGRMVTPGTYMFTVETKDAMFPSVTNKASAVFPVDMYRVVDVATTDVYGDSEAKATISYMLSKAMNVQINIYNKDVVIPAYNSTTGDYNDYTVISSQMATGYTNDLASVNVYEQGQTNIFATLSDVALGTVVRLQPGTTNPYTRDTITTAENPNYVEGSAVAGEEQYFVTLKRESVNVTTNTTTTWPPRICDKTTDAAIFTAAGYVDPAKVTSANACIYVNDTTFTNYPETAAKAASGVLDVRLQPIKTFDRSATKEGDGLLITEEWDALYFYNPTPSTERHTQEEITACKNATDLKQCPYEMVPDGQYPFFISARSNEPFNRYYANGGETIAGSNPQATYLPGAPFKTAAEVVQQDYLYATEKPVSKINVTRGPVYFLDGSVVVYPNAPQLFNASSGPVFIPPYEINFAVSRASTVEVAVVALKPNMCYGTTGTLTQRNTTAGEVCKYLSTMTIVNTSDFDPNITRKIYWDGTDNNGIYVKPGIYEIRLTAKNYPDPGLYQETVKSVTVNADLLKVFDLLEADGYSLSQRNTDMKIGYQISVPMKVAIQIFKPGTTIYDYQKGTLRNPTTGTEVKDIHEVLVRAIVGIRPATTLIEELWDGRDYAQQEVPDGTYPFRFVTALNSADIDSVTGEILGSDDSSTNSQLWSVEKVADTYEYQNLHKATVAIGDGRFVCEDWEKTVFFYPNPLRDASKGTLEITKMPVPGTVSIKFFNLAGDLVRDSNYTCVDANNYQITMGSSLQFNPDNTPTGSTQMTDDDLAAYPNIRNAALRCRWDRTNQHGKKVARGVYFGLVDFKAQNGREHCQKVVKILVP